MNKLFRICIVLGIIFLALYIIIQILGGMFIGGLLNPPTNEKDMIELFDKDKEILCKSADDLSEKGDIYLCLDEDSSKEELTEISKKLYDRGYEIISKNDTCVSYQKWSNLDAGRGFVYSYNGTEPSLQFMTKLIPLNKKRLVLL